MTIDNLLNKTLTIKRKTVSYSDAGISQVDWTTVASDVPCTVQDLSGEVSKANGRWLSRKQCRVFLQSSPDIQPEDHVIIDSVTFLVVHVSDPMERGNHLEAILVQPPLVS